MSGSAAAVRPHAGDAGDGGGSFWLLRELDVELFAGKSGAGHTPDLYMENFVTTAMEPARGARCAAWRPSTWRISPTPIPTSSQRPYMVMYRDEGREPWHVRSERGWVSASGDVMLLLGKVHIWRNNVSGLKELDIKTEDLRVLPDEEYGETDKPVVITTPTHPDARCGHEGAPDGKPPGTAEQRANTP